MAEAMEWEEEGLGRTRPLDDQNSLAIMEKGHWKGEALDVNCTYQALSAMTEAMDWEEECLGRTRPLDDQNSLPIMEDDTSRQQRQPGQVFYRDYNKVTSSLSSPLGDTDAGCIHEDYSEQLILVKNCYLIDEDYKIISDKICGGKATVYKCQDKKSKYPFVIKVLKQMPSMK